MSTVSRAWLFSLTALYAISLSTSMAAMEGVSAILAFFAIFQIWKKRKVSGLFDGVSLLTVGLILAIFLSLILGPVRPVIWDRALGMVKNLVIFLLLRQVFAEFSMRERLQLAWVALGAAAVVGLVALSQHFTCIDYLRGRAIFGAIVNGESDCRAVGLFSSSMSYGHAVALPSAILAGLVILGEPPKWGTWMAAGGVWGGLFACFQRGPWIGFIAALVMVSSRLTHQVKLAFASLATVFIVGVSFYSVQLRDRLFSILSLQSISNRERLSLWQANWEIFKDHPLLGVGFSHNDKVLPEYFQKLGVVNGFVSHAHNNVVDFLSGTGIVGVSLYLGLLGLIVRRSYVAPGWSKGWRVGFVAMQVALFVAGLTECNFKDGEVTHQFIFWTALALAAGA